MTEIGAYLDEDNRRLHEVDFREEQEREVYTRCPFRDSRHGLLMNKSALNQIGSNWGSIMAGVGYFSALFPPTLEGEDDLARAWRISLATMFAPLYLLKRPLNPFPNGKLPAPVAGVFKIMLDVSTTIDLMVMSEGSNHPVRLSRQRTAQEVRDYAEKHLLLLNGRYVCAGPDSLIHQVTHLLFCPIDELTPMRGAFDSFILDRTEFMAFAYLMSVQYIVGVTYQLVTMALMERAFRELNRYGLYVPQPSNEGQVFPSAYERRRRIALDCVLDETARTNVLIQVHALASSPHNWGMAKLPGMSRPFLDNSISVLKDSEFMSAPEINELHKNFKRTAVSEIHKCQRSISTVVPDPELFPPNPFGTLDLQMPDVILNNLLSSNAP
jgi:hypothetical protein